MIRACAFIYALAARAGAAPADIDGVRVVAAERGLATISAYILPQINEALGRVRRAEMPPTSRGDAAAATWKFGRRDRRAPQATFQHP